MKRIEIARGGKATSPAQMPALKARLSRSDNSCRPMFRSRSTRRSPRSPGRLPSRMNGASPDWRRALFQVIVRPQPATSNQRFVAGGERSGPLLSADRRALWRADNHAQRGGNRRHRPVPGDIQQYVPRMGRGDAERGDHNTGGESCWTGGGGGYGPSTPCDHFGVGTKKTPTSTTYSWLTETAPNSPTLNNVSPTLPAPVQVVTPPPAPACRAAARTAPRCRDKSWRCLPTGGIRGR